MAVRTSRQSAPARTWVTVTPSDTTLLPAGCCGLFVTSTGAVALQGADGNSVTFTLTEAGRVLPLGPIRVLLTGTSATGIIALY